MGTRATIGSILVSNYRRNKWARLVTIYDGRAGRRYFGHPNTHLVYLHNMILGPAFCLLIDATSQNSHSPSYDCLKDVKGALSPCVLS